MTRWPALKIKIAQELADELAQTPRQPDRIHETIICKSNGTPLGYALALRDLKEFTADLGHETVPHGLRKNAVNALLEAGSTIPEVSAITGQSFRIVEQYGKRMNRGVMSDSGVTKLDDRRKSKRDNSALHAECIPSYLRNGNENINQSQRAILPILKGDCHVLAFRILR